MATYIIISAYVAHLFITASIINGPVHRVVWLSYIAVCVVRASVFIAVLVNSRPEFLACAETL